MLIQDASNAAQAAQPVRRASDGAPTVVADTSNAAKQAPAQQPSSEQLKNAVDSINQAMQQSNQNLELSVDSTTKKPIIKMMDSETGELIRQFPSEEVLAIASSIDQFLEFQQGLLLKQKA